MEIDKKKTIDDEAGAFALEFIENNLYLTVSRAELENNISLNFITQYVQKVDDIGDIDVNAIQQAIEKINEPFLVAKLKEPELEVKIFEDKMSATARIVGRIEPGEFPKETALKQLNDAGVTFGLDLQEIDRLIENPGESFIVAVGKNPVNGIDATINFTHDINEKRGTPKEIEGGRVDYKNLELFLAVLENEVLAEKIPATKAENGSTVTGSELRGKDGKDKRIKIGKNVKNEENLYIAKIAGQLIANSDKIDILPILELRNDIDFSTGNISFPGSVVVRGNVQAGFEVKAQGSVLVHGNICGGIVEGKTVEVKHGIQGATNSYVKAVETVSAKFIENTTVYAGENVIVADAILHSRISAGRKILAVGSKGIITGGYLSAGDEINAKTIGTPMAPPTTVEVGVSPMLKEEYVRLRTEYNEATEKLDGVQKSLKLLKPTEQSTVEPNRLELYTKLIRNKFALMERVTEIKDRIAFIENEFESLTNGHIKCSGSLYPGVKLVINNIIYPIRDVFEYSSFYAENGEVKFSSYS